jgi:NAD(P)-dependent dehydrogenase (short-subunit alcohol dehydrogenase family)
MDINFKGLVCCTRYFLEYRLTNRRSSIVNLTSIAARTGGMPGNSLYAASKGAISSFTIASAKELAPAVRVNAIAPGIIDTPIQADVFASSTTPSSMTEYVPMRRLGTTEEIASAALWLLSDDASYITGTVLDVDGGVATPLWSPAWRTP